MLLDRCEWLYPCLAMLANSRREPLGRLWPFPPGTLQAEFTNHVRRLHIGTLGASLYTLRHGGASDDLMCQRRTLAETKRRGRWKSEGSLARYAKETHLLAEIKKVSCTTLAYGVLIEQHITAVLSGRRTFPPLL